MMKKQCAELKFKVKIQSALIVLGMGWEPNGDGNGWVLDAGTLRMMDWKFWIV